MKFSIVLFFLLFTSIVYSQQAKMYPCRTACNIGIQMSDHKSGDSISLFDFLKIVGIKPERGKFTILSYKITMDGEGFNSEIWEVENIGEKFTENTISYFRKLRPGAYVTFDCITAKDSYGYITGLKSAFYLVR